jgi:hypothetical protein
MWPILQQKKTKNDGLLTFKINILLHGLTKVGSDFKSLNATCLSVARKRKVFILCFWLPRDWLLNLPYFGCSLWTGEYKLKFLFPSTFSLTYDLEDKTFSCRVSNTLLESNQYAHSGEKYFFMFLVLVFDLPFASSQYPKTTSWLRRPEFSIFFVVLTSGLLHAYTVSELNFVCKCHPKQAHTFML